MARKRKSGTGTIRQRKDGRWEGRAVVGYDDKGLPKTKNVLAKTKHECQEKLTKLMETVGSAKSEKICADMPFGEWMDFWYQTYIKSGLRPATQNTYESTIYQHIIPQLGKIPLCQLTQKDLQQFYAYLKKEGRLVRTEQYGKGLSDRMVRMCHAKCRAALDQAVQENLIRTNPAVGCKLPPKRRDGRCRCCPARNSSDFSFRQRRMATSNCFCWTCPLAFAGANCWPSNGPIWIWIPERCP